MKALKNTLIDSIGCISLLHHTQRRQRRTLIVFNIRYINDSTCTRSNTSSSDVTIYWRGKEKMSQPMVLLLVRTFSAHAFMLVQQFYFQKNIHVILNSTLIIRRR